MDINEVAFILEVEEGHSYYDVIRTVVAPMFVTSFSQLFFVRIRPGPWGIPEFPGILQPRIPIGNFQKFKKN